MKSFKVTEFNAPLAEFDEPTPQPAGTQVLLKVVAAGVCHSDLHIWEGGYDLGHGRKPLSLRDRGVSLPRTMGHESVGQVVALGPDAKGDIKVGDICLVYPWLGCGQCDTCLAGQENMCLKSNALGIFCDGGYADHMTVPNPKYLINLKGLDPVSAAPYACSGVTTYSALKKVEEHLGQPIVIFGAGGLGLMALSLLKAMGGKGAIVVDIGAPWALPLIPMKAVTIQGSYVGNLRETQELLDLVRTRHVPPIPVTPMPLDQADAALRALKEGKLVGRAVLTP